MDVANYQKKKSKKDLELDMNSVFGLVRTDNLQQLKEFVEKNGTSILNSTDNEGFTPMHWATYEGSFEIIRYLIENGAEYDNSKNQSEQKPIHWASVKGRIDAINLLINKGVDINSQDKKGYTPLITASQYGQLSLVCFLVSKGAKLEKDDINGDNALHWATYKGYPDLTRLLIIFGLNPKRIDNYGQSLLHLACLSGKLNIVQSLILQDNVDPEIRDKNGKKAVDLARVRGHSDLVDFIERYNRDRKNKYCNIKTFLFGPVGNSKFVFYLIHLLYFLYQYPLYFYIGIPETWDSHFELNLAYIFNNVIMWVLLYSVHFQEPGYLPVNTVDYQNFLRKITFRSQTFDPADWNHNLARLCHTCKTIKPLRASHCRACNRCVLAYDHHCPYIQNCVGYKNRPLFFLFVASMASLQLLTLNLIYIVVTNKYDYYIVYPGLFLVVIFCIMAIVLLCTALNSSLYNLTSNEVAKTKKYDYLKGPNGEFRNIFSKSKWYNFKYYFHFVEPSHLEVYGYENLLNHHI